MKVSTRKLSKSWFRLVRRAIPFRLLSPHPPQECAELLESTQSVKIRKSLVEWSFRLWVRVETIKHSDTIYFEVIQEIGQGAHIRSNGTIEAYGNNQSLIEGEVQIDRFLFGLFLVFSVIYPLVFGFLALRLGIFAIIIVGLVWSLLLWKRKILFDLIAETVDAYPTQSTQNRSAGVDELEQDESGHDEEDWRELAEWDEVSRHHQTGGA